VLHLAADRRERAAVFSCRRDAEPLSPQGLDGTWVRQGVLLGELVLAAPSGLYAGIDGVAMTDLRGATRRLQPR